MNLHKIANVLEAAADYVDAVETEKLAAAESTRRANADKVAAAHAAAHGEEIPDDIRRKLSSADPEVLSYVENVLAKSAGVVDSLGAPATPADADQPSTVKEAAAEADKRFLSWLVS